MWQKEDWLILVFVYPSVFLFSFGLSSPIYRELICWVQFLCFLLWTQYFSAWECTCFLFFVNKNNSPICFFLTLFCCETDSNQFLLRLRTELVAWRLLWLLCQCDYKLSASLAIKAQKWSRASSMGIGLNYPVVVIQSALRFMRTWFVCNLKLPMQILVGSDDFGLASDQIWSNAHWTAYDSLKVKRYIWYTTQMNS